MTFVQPCNIIMRVGQKQIGLIHIKAFDIKAVDKYKKREKFEIRK